jgi:hypothetical protein
MARRRKPARPGDDTLKQPRAYLAEDGKWPYGPLVDNPPKEVLLAQGICKKILHYSQKRQWTRHHIAQEAAIGYQSLYTLLNGTTWPDIVTVARLEMLFKRRLFGNEPRPRHRKPRSEPG